MTRLSCCFVTTLILASAFSLSACGTPSPAPSPSPSMASGVRGPVVISGGPASPDLAPFSRPAKAYPIAAHRGDVTGKVVATAQTDFSGSFTMDLPPGTYTLSAAVVTTMAGVSPQTVTVEPNHYVKVRLVINIP